MSDTQHKAAIKRAIERAEEHAGDDDRVFATTLKFAALTAASAGGGARSVSIGRGKRPGGPRLADDPRYRANLRALARRTMRNARIVGGSKVTGAEFADCVAVGDDTDWGCTGTLIAPNVVLTAGHCHALHTRIFIGNDVTKRGRVFRVRQHVRHPKFTSQLRNDLMILILEEKVSGVEPRRLAPAAVLDASTDGRVVGFGTTDRHATRGLGIKRQVDVPIVSEACSGNVNGKRDSSVYGCFAGLELIAGKPLLLRDTCEGDSGGPLFVADKGRWLLAGVTSRGTALKQTLCGDGGVYVRIDKYRPWIQSVIDQAKKKS